MLSSIFFLIFTSKNIVINFKIIIILKNIYVKNCRYRTRKKNKKKTNKLINKQKA